MSYLDYKKQVQEKLSAPERKQAFAFADSFQNGQVMCGIAIGTSSNKNAITPTKQASYVLCKIDANDNKLPEDIYNAIVNCNKVLYEVLDIEDREPAFVDAWTASRLDAFKQEREQKLQLEQEKTKVDAAESVIAETKEEPAGDISDDANVVNTSKEDISSIEETSERQQNKTPLRIDLSSS